MSTSISTAAFAAFAASMMPASALTLDYPAAVLAQAAQAAALSSYAMPVGPFAGDAMQTRVVEGAVDTRAVRLDAPGATTLQLLTPLRDQLTRAGYVVVYECAAFDCGGFDFRYGMEVLPEPDMHVDLGDYRYLFAERPGSADAVSLLVSRSAQAGFVQVVTVGPGAAAVVPDVTASTKSPVAAAPLPRAVAPPAEPEVRVLEDLVFASGDGALASAHYASIAGLAATLRANPAMAVTLLGHTDATGPLAANIAISQQRADAVKAALVADGIAADRITTTGMGPKAPRADNDTAEGRRQNRRVEAMIAPTVAAP